MQVLQEQKPAVVPGVPSSENTAYSPHESQSTEISTGNNSGIFAHTCSGSGLFLSVLWMVSIDGRYMKKLAIFILLLLLVIGGIGFFIVNNAGSIIKDVIESTGPEYLGADVSVGNIELSLTEGLCVISNLEIGNPEGFDGDYAMRLDKIRVVLDTSSLASEVIVIKQVSIAGASLHTIVKGTSDTNFQKIADNVDAALGPQAPASDTDEFKMIIDKLDFVDADVSVSSDLLGDSSLSIPDIHLKDVGRSSNGATAGEVAKQVLAPISKRVLSALLKSKLNLGDMDEKIDNVKKGLKSKLMKRLGKLGKSE